MLLVYPNYREQQKAPDNLPEAVLLLLRYTDRQRENKVSITLELPLDLETALTTKAQHQGLSVPDLLLQLARKEAESGAYTSNDRI